MSDTDQILMLLGELKHGQERLRADFVDEKEHTRESRERMHTKLEKIEEDVGIVGQVAAQARDKALAVEKVVTDDVQPVTDEIKRMKLMGAGAMVAAGIAGGLFGVSAVTFGKDAIAAIARLLKIIP